MKINKYYLVLLYLLIFYILFYFIFFYIYKIFNVKEAFYWSSETKDNFIKFENTYNPTYKFDTNIVSSQASEDDVKYLIENNKWKWTQNTQDLYKEAILSSTNIKIDPSEALEDAQKIYNEKAILQLLSWSTKEGIFLLSGSLLPNSIKQHQYQDQEQSDGNIIKCGFDENTNSNVLQKIINVGYNEITGSINQNITFLKNEEIENNVNGFKFLNKPCNPCGPLNDTPDYSCPFSINVGEGNNISTSWKKLWGL